MCLAHRLGPVAVIVLLSLLSSLSLLLFLVVVIQYCHHPSLHGSCELRHHDVQFLRNRPKFVETPTPHDLVDVECSRISPLFLPPLSSLTHLNLDLKKAKQTQLNNISKNMSWAFGMFLLKFCY